MKDGEIVFTTCCSVLVFVSVSLTRAQCQGQFLAGSSSRPQQYSIAAAGRLES
eukprot:COSAG06_NODE_40059_length_406_cov_0.596091_1_plen_52_part_01